MSLYLSISLLGDCVELDGGAVIAIDTGDSGPRATTCRATTHHRSRSTDHSAQNTLKQLVSVPIVCDHLFAARVLQSSLFICSSPSVSAVPTLSLPSSLSAQTPLRPPYICRETIAIRTAQYGCNPPIWACNPQPVDRRAEGLSTTAAESRRLWALPGRLTDGRCAAGVLSACWGLTTTPCQGSVQASNEMVIRYLSRTPSECSAGLCRHCL